MKEKIIIKVSITTLNNYTEIIKVSFNFLKEQNYIKKDIVKNIKPFKNERKVKKKILVTDEQFLILLHTDSRYKRTHEYRGSCI